MADTGSLILWGGLASVSGAESTGIALLGCALLMLVGVVGLFRLRVWALFLNIFANVLVACLTGFDWIDAGPLKLLFVTTAILQLLVPLPLFVSMVTKKPVKEGGFFSNIAPWIPAGSLVLTILLAVQPLFGQSVLISLGAWLLG